MEKQKLINTSVMLKHLADSEVLDFIKDYRVNEGELTVALETVGAAMLFAGEMLDLGYKAQREMFFVRIEIKD